MRWSVLLLVLGCGRRDLTSSVPANTRAEPIAAARGSAAGDAAASPCAGDPVELLPGLVASRAPLRATPIAGGAPCIDVVRADLARFRARILTAAKDGGSHTAPAWRETFHLAAVINAGMFHEGGAPVALLVEDGAAVGADNTSMQGFLAFDPRAPSDPPAVITGRDCAGFDLAALKKRYRSVVQSSRLLGCDGTALPWADKKQYSSAAIGVDRHGRLVLLHARAAVTMTELSAALAAPDLDLAGALFLEGGPEASLVVHGTSDLSRVGSYETGFVENDGNQAFWWLPNVIGLEVRR